MSVMSETVSPMPIQPVSEEAMEKGSSVYYTVTLTREFEKGNLTAVQYSDRRAKIVGKPNVITSLLTPILNLLRERAAGPEKIKVEKPGGDHS